MLTGIHISNVFVTDQDEALAFYVGTLGLEVSADIDFGAMRWLTVRAPGQAGRDILLERAGPPSVDEGAAEQLRELIAKGASGFAVGFTTDDCQATFERLRAAGVEITQEPIVHFYGTDFGLRDPFGNHIRIVQLASPDGGAT